MKIVPKYKTKVTGNPKINKNLVIVPAIYNNIDILIYMNNYPGLSSNMRTHISHWEYSIRNVFTGYMICFLGTDASSMSDNKQYKNEVITLYETDNIEAKIEILLRLIDNKLYKKAVSGVNMNEFMKTSILTINEN